jgi:NADPH:quinone reductase-like Zn-dependent oxidoreductase
MKAVQLYGYGDVDQLRYEDAPDPKPQADEILVRVAAASINPVDWKIRQGHLKEMMPLQFPAILGRDVAGEVIETGANVQNFKKGDRVLGLINRGYAELVAAKASAFALVPEGLDLPDAAALPLVTLTGAQLIEKGVKPKAGDKVLVAGAFGGVGRTAVYVAKQHGAFVIAGVKRSQKEEAARIGADAVIALDSDQEIASLEEVDAIADAVDGETANKLLPKLKKTGVFASVLGKPSALGDGEVHFEQVWAQPDAARLAQLASDVRNKKFVIPIGKRFKLNEIRQAQQLAENGGVGKVVLLP